MVAIPAEIVALPASDPRYATFLHLFRMEIIELFSDVNNVLQLEQFRQYFDFDDKDLADIFFIMDEIRNAGPSEKERKVTALDFFLDVVFENPEAVEELDNTIRLLNPRLWNEAHLASVESNSPVFKLFMDKFFPDGKEELLMLDRCAAALEPEFFVESLTKFNNPYPELLPKTLKPPLNSAGKEDHRHWAACILRTMPHLVRSTDDWFYDFVEACSKDPYNRAVLWYLLPNYEEVLENRLIERRRRQGGRSIRDDDVIGEVEVVTTMRKPSDYVKFRASDYDDVQEPETLVLRPYQEELVESALRGKNVIACAPTGSGKTEVCIYVAMSHLDAKADKNEPARVAMLVPRIPLVDQQKLRFHKYVRGKYYVEGFHGSEGSKSTSRRDTVLASDIVVMTPQIMLNMLKSVRQDERVYVCDFSLLIFDEVHHCAKEHPYNILMQIVHDYQGPKPQTMGLTASLGVGMATSDESGMASIYELMANIGATSLASVKRHLDILEQYVPKPVDMTRKVDRPPMGESPFLRTLMNIMEKIQRDVEPKLKSLTQDNSTGFKLSKEEVKFEDPLVTEKYIQKVNTLATTLGKVYSGDFKFEPSIALEYLGVLSQGISINDLMPAKYALEYLQKNLGELSRKFEVECSQRFYQHFAQNAAILSSLAEQERYKPIVEALENELKEQFVKDANSRAIVFVTRRSTAVELMNYLNTEKVLGRHDLVGFVTSTSKKSAEYGQTKEEQQKALDDFNRGKRKVIIATSVVEEGLDVSTCNLIIKYNSSSNAVQRVQRRGRARARDSRSVLIVLSENVAQTEYQAIMAEKIMNKCLKRIQEQGEKVLEKRVKEVMDRQAKERRIVLEHRMKAREALMDKLACGACATRRACNSGPAYSLSCSRTLFFRIRLRYEKNPILFFTYWMNDSYKEYGVFWCPVALQLFTIRCKIDSRDVCASTFVRTINGSSYVCVDPSIWSRHKITTKEISTKMKYVDEVTQILAEVLCKCGQSVGNVMKYAGTYLPTLNIRNLMFYERIEGKETAGEAITTWSKASERFWIPEASEQELRDMLRSLAAEDKENKILLDVMCDKMIAVQEKLLEKERKKKEDTMRIKTDWE
ncbi:hypothetical protein Y032_0013g2053 [Ancylostoma ceylanicum]|uniref:RNA helicase n=1 Tax=Ancylostoma ceylanicum TaxID=53326 RepID=A0A016VAK5_9BILA|nr:hypothetical protein Y032_0013g2053 [Ancylostoma ceylanicum]